jgi:hypothetical protein
MECTNGLIFTAEVDKRYIYRLMYKKMLTRMHTCIYVISNIWYQNVYKSLQKRANEIIFTAKVDNMTTERLMSKEMPTRMRVWVYFTFTFKWANVRNYLQKCVNDLIFTVLVGSTCIYVHEQIKKNMQVFFNFFFSIFPPNFFLLFPSVI